jgi:lipopolysaccharide export system permease protein
MTLHEATRSRLTADGVFSEQAQRIDRPTLLDPELVQVVMLKPEKRRYRQAFWGKLAAPLQGLVMLLVGLPFAFGSARNSPLGKRLVIGIVVGLLFLLVSRLFSQAGHAFDIQPVVAALLPSLLFLGVAGVALRRVR